MRRRGGTIIGGIAILGSIVIFIIPFAFIVMTALKDKREASLRGFSLPTSFHFWDNLVEVVKDYMSYEQETLTKVIEARGKAMGATGTAAIAQAEGQLSGALGKLFAVMEAYPDLKTNQNVMSLQEELTSTENKIAFARQYFNDSVMRFNNATQVFPSNVIAWMLNFKEEEFYKVPEGETEPVKVKLR